MPKNKIVGGLQLMFTPQALFPFLIGSVALAVLGNSVFQLLINWFTAATSSVLIIAISALLILILMTWLLSHFVNQARPAPPLVGKKQPEKRKGIIVLVSNESVARKAIEYHQDSLEQCWLVCSTQAKSMQAASNIKNSLDEQRKKAEIVVINDVFDPIECKNKIESIYSDLPQGFAENDVILDFTGMTAVVSVGSVLACLDENRPIQYTLPEFSENLEAVRPQTSIEIILHWNALKLAQSVLTAESIQRTAEEKSV